MDFPSKGKSMPQDIFRVQVDSQRKLKIINLTGEKPALTSCRPSY
jgi:hypothetical protein